MSDILIRGMEMPEKDGVGLFLYPDGQVNMWRPHALVGQKYKAIPAADVRPVMRGKWEKMSPWSEGVGMGESYGYYYSCSECEKQVRGDYKTCGFAYCPNCGAVMEES